MKNLLLFTLYLFFAAAQAQEQQYTVYFQQDSDILTDESAANLEKWIAANRDAEIYKIEAYADTTGTVRHNNMLTVMRSSYLATKLAPKGKFDVISKGEGFSKTGGPEDRKAVISYRLPQKPAAPAPPPSAPVQKEEPELARQVTTAKKGDRLVLRNVGFVGGIDKVLEESMPALHDLLQIMKDRPTLKIEIQGHICCYHGDMDNLSVRRAKTVYTYLVENGIDKKRLSYKGFGGSKPIYMMPELDEKERQANRRVEIQIVSL